MNNKKIAETAKDVMLPIAEELGYEILEVSFGKQFGADALSVIIDNEAGIQFEDCEKFTKAVSDALDDADPTGGASYNFNVSSAGIDRPFKTDRDFNRNIGNEVETRLFAPMKGKKVYTGILTGFTDKDVTLQLENETVKIERQKIAKITLVIKF